MSDRQTYYAEAGSWADDARLAARRSRQTAWLIAGVAVAAAAFEAVALAMLAPLKTVQPVTLLVDRQTGYVQALDPLTPQRIGADAALTNAFLAQYVTAREGFDRATVRLDYRKVGLWSAARARTTYLAGMASDNPASPFQAYPSGTIVTTQIKSVSRLAAGVSLVRFDTSIEARDGRQVVPQSWIAVVRYRFLDAPMSFEDRLVNPLGFQVTGYRRDAEAPTPVVPVVTATPANVIVTPASAIPMASNPAYRSNTSIRPTVYTPRRKTPPIAYVGSATNARPVTAARDVPINQIPLGSPLGPPSPIVALSKAPH